MSRVVDVKIDPVDQEIAPVVDEKGNITFVVKTSKTDNEEKEDERMDTE